MQNCGKRFHSEVGKFRFLNELIKVVSPKVRNPVSIYVIVYQLIHLGADPHATEPFKPNE